MRWVVHFNKEPCDIYVGRPSIYGNPYHIGIDGTREEVIRRHEVYVFSRPELIKKIRQELPGKILGCYCFPLLCHAELLVRIANGWQLCPL